LTPPKTLGRLDLQKATGGEDPVLVVTNPLLPDTGYVPDLKAERVQ
jgi:hypothetical protein